MVISARESPIVQMRCRELSIAKVYQGCTDKYACLLKMLKDDAHPEKSFLSRVAYIGDDVLDLNCMRPLKKFGGIVGCPANAVSEVLALSDFVSAKRGGDGAVYKVMVTFHVVTFHVLTFHAMLNLFQHLRYK